MTVVAVTGLGVVSAFGVGVAPFWDGLLAGRSGLTVVDEFVALGSPRVGVVPGLEVRAFAHTPAARRIDRTSLLALAACRLAVADAGGLPSGLADDAIGLTLGSSLGSLGETSVFLDRLFARGVGNPLLFPNLVMNAALSYASIELGIVGPTAMVTEQEASGEAAIQWGAQMVAEGRVAICLAGASDELSPIVAEVFRDAGIVTPDVPRPLDRAATGCAMGEGAAVLLLERFDSARERGARVYATIVPHQGFSVAAPVFGWPTDADATGRLLGELTAGADLIVSGADGVPHRDRAEAALLVAASAGRRIAVTAPRGAIGSFGSTGALGVATAVLAVHHGCVPPTLGCETPLRDLDVVRGAPRELSIRVAVVHGLARGGVCRPVRIEAVRA